MCRLMCKLNCLTTVVALQASLAEFTILDGGPSTYDISLVVSIAKVETVSGGLMAESLV